ncbi:hypothetical protein JL722_10885 [Aureococcus anophagefferens]|nr:hypothetical protein JL722_10885 [Aureococcus anophagefferens]
MKQRLNLDSNAMADAAAAALLDAARAETQAANAAASDLETQLARSEAAKARLEAAVGLAARESAQLHGQVDEARETLELCRLDLEAALLEGVGGGGARARRRGGEARRRRGDDRGLGAPALAQLKALSEADAAAAASRLAAAEAAFRAASVDGAWRAAHEAELDELRERARDDAASLELVEALSGRNLDLEDRAERLAAQVADLERDRDLADELDGAQAEGSSLREASAPAWSSTSGRRVATRPRGDAAAAAAALADAAAAFAAGLDAADDGGDAISAAAAKKLTVPRLRRSSRRGLATDGLKAALVERLASAGGAAAPCPETLAAAVAAARRRARRGALGVGARWRPRGRRRRAFRRRAEARGDAAAAARAPRARGEKRARRRARGAALGALGGGGAAARSAAPSATPPPPRPARPRARRGRRPPRLWRSRLVVALAAARPRAPGQKKQRPSFVRDNHARPVFYFHIPGTGGSTMEFAAARYACKMGLEMNSVYKGAEPICDVGAAHVSLATLQAWRAPRPTGLRATQVRDPAGHALKAP